MSLEDGVISRACRLGILNSITEGFVVGNNWFEDEDREGFLGHMSGTEFERKALSSIVEAVEGGFHVRSDGLVMDLEDPVIRLEDSSCHPVLVSLWPDYGMGVLEDLFGLTGMDAEEVHSRQAKRKQGFGAFLRELNESLSTARSWTGSLGRAKSSPRPSLSLTGWSGKLRMMVSHRLSRWRGKDGGWMQQWVGHG